MVAVDYHVDPTTIAVCVNSGPPPVTSNIATFNANGTVTWTDGAVWTPTKNPSPFITVTDSNHHVSNVALVNSVMLIGLIGDMQGVTGRRTGNKIYWSNGEVWQDFDFNALNAFFEMGL